MKTTIQFQIGLLTLALLAGCKQNPFSSSMQPGQRIVTQNPNQNQIPKIYSIEAPDLIECTEDAECAAEIRGHVPDPGEAILTMQGLPKEALYDPVTQKFAYKPGFDVVDVANHPEQTVMVFPVKIKVRSTADAVTETSKQITLIVKNKAQSAEVKVVGSSQVDEGETLEQTVEVIAPDFPQGPFSLAAVGAPVGVEISAVSGTPNQFNVKYSPGFNVANVFGTRDPNGYYSKSFPISFQANLPVGAPAKKDLSWTVNDVRQNAAISAPETMTEGLDVMFSIRADDLNDEAAPRINVSPNVPFGKLSVSTVLDSDGSKGHSLPSKVVLVRWDDLKLTHIGTTTPIHYEVCVQRYNGSFNFCAQKKVMITLRARSHFLPEVDRLSWSPSLIRTFQLGQESRIRLPWMTPNLKSVQIEANHPESVLWDHGMLTVNPQTTGDLYFTLVAENEIGERVSEAFQSVVLPTVNEEEQP